MEHKLRNLLTIVLLVVGFSSCSIYETNTFSDYENGVKAAARDIADGRYARLDCYGIIRSGTKEMEQILKRRYGIESRTDRSVGSDYLMGYNTTMHSASKARFGNDYYEKAIKELWRSQPDSGQFGLMPPVVD
jgi:hypothetical protein